MDSLKEDYKNDAEDFNQDASFESNGKQNKLVSPLSEDL